MSDTAHCPRCGHPSEGDLSCPRCGVVFSKLKSTGIRRSHAMTRAALGGRRPSHGVLVRMLLLFLTVVALALLCRHTMRMTTPPVALVVSPTPSPVAALDDANDARFGMPREAPSNDIATDSSNVEALDSGDAAIAKTLAFKLRQRSPLTSNDLITAETLSARHPEEDSVGDLLHALLLLASSQSRQRRLFDVSRRHLQRAVAVRPGNLDNDRAFLSLHLELGEWTLAEQSARRILKRAPNEAEAARGLAFALMRLDRDREAIAILDDLLKVREDAEARALRARLDKSMSDERGMRERRLSHFDVRYDGDAHEDVGREILRGLERHHAALTIAFGFQPSAPIPVILFTQQAFFDASGAPTWAGGVYDAIDGRIRIPIGGLTKRLTPGLDSILVHELTHAFVADRTRGVASRELHEGLAQYMEGKRIESVLSPAQIDDLARGGIGGVVGFYHASLALVEYMMRLRGQGGINDLLALMGENGDAGAAFRRVYGKDPDVMLRDAMQYHSRRATR
ncbi:MAG: tetratricopeptide repeat protein [Vicinamibacteria bacterium]|nr:tetratricopeptide repeat protein [Vicinamibacteria bacterium]